MRALSSKWAIPQEVCDTQTAQFGEERCSKCPIGGGCFQPRAAHQPLPLWFWVVFGALAAAPLCLVLRPHRARSWFYTGVTDEQTAAAWRRGWYDKVFRDVGIADPAKVVVFETDVPLCTSLGTNTEAGAVVFIPKMLAALTNPETFLRIPGPGEAMVFEGKVGELTPEIRARILQQTGVLLPEVDEIRYVIGHEASHIFFNHAIKNSLAGALSATAAHLALKLYNRWAWARSSHGADLSAYKPVTSKVGHLAVLILSTLLSSVCIARYQERQADLHSAMRLRLKTPAIELTRKKQQQNIIEHDRGDLLMTARGDDLRDWEHPFITQQLAYLDGINEAAGETASPSVDQHQACDDVCES